MPPLPRKIEEVAGATLVLLTALAITTTLWAVWKNYDKGGWSDDTAAWVQAAGSIIAIVAAAWLARGQERQARRFRRQVAEQIAAGVVFAIKQAQYDSQIVAYELTTRSSPIKRREVRGWRQRMLTAAVVLEAESSRGDHIHASIGQVAANGKVLVDEAIANLTTMSDAIGAGEQPDKEIIDDIVHTHQALKELEASLADRLRLIRDALDNGGDLLPLT